MISVEGTQDFIRAAHALNELGDREVRKAVYKGFRAEAKPLGQEMIEALADDMPKRGGLSARVRASKVSIRNATTGNNPRVAITVNGPYGARALGSMNAGTVRHPVFARADRVTNGRMKFHNRVWVSQRVPAGAATRKFEEGAPRVRARLIRELDTVMTEAARKV